MTTEEKVLINVNGAFEQIPLLDAYTRSTNRLLEIKTLFGTLYPFLEKVPLPYDLRVAVEMEARRPPS